MIRNVLITNNKNLYLLLNPLFDFCFFFLDQGWGPQLRQGVRRGRQGLRGLVQDGHRQEVMDFNNVLHLEPIKKMEIKSIF